MSTFSRTATLFSTVVLGSMLTTTTVSSVNTIVNAAETTQAVATKKNYDLKILQGNSDATSTASQFYLNTISLEKQANGNYYAYLTSNTPVNLGDEPISSEDTQHQVVKMGTTQKNGYNQTVYRLTLTADELASGQPIKTKIHVNIPMMNYDHDYDIRLAVQGFKPEAASSSSSSSSSSTANSSHSVSSSSNNASTSIADSSTTTSVAPSSSSQTSSSAQSSNNDTAISSVVNNEQNNSSNTASSAVVSDDKTTSSSSTDSTVNIAADQGMSRFLKPTARINVKGEQTDITLSLNDASLAKMIPSLTLDGQTKSVSGQDTTFTVPTKDLTPDKDGKLTLKSLTHVSAQGYTHDYPSNITFDVSQLIAQNNLKAGNYQIAVSPDSHMDSFFAKEFNVKVGALTSVVSVTYQVPSMMGMIPSVTFDGQTKSVVNKSTTVDFTIPTKDLVPGKDGKVTLKSFTSVPMSPSKGYNSNITFDMNPALVKSTSDSSHSSSSSSESASSDKDILQDGTYSINYNVYKSGTTTDSTMKTYMKSPANVAVKNGQATITFATQNDAMSMMKEFSVNDVAAKADGNNWVVTVPVSALSKTMKSYMTIFVAAINFTEHPSADIAFDMSSIKKTGNNDGSTASSSPASSASPSSKVSSSSSSHASSASSSSKTDKQIDIHKNAHYVLGYRVYKTGTKTTSTMQQYMTSTAVVDVKNGQATITFATQNDAMSMMKEFSVNDVAAKADGNNWVVTVPVAALSKTMTSNMTIFVSAINFTEHPSADIVFDMSSVKKIGNNGGSAASSSSVSSASSSSKASSASSSHASSASSSSKASSASSSHASSASSSSKASSASSSHASSASSSSKASSASSSHASSASSSSKASSASSSHASSASSSSKASSASSSHASSASSSSKASSASSSHASSASSSSKASSASSSHASSASSSSQSNSKTDITKDGKYSVNYHVYKSGTTTASAMEKYMTSSASVAVKNSKATITFATQNDAMSMMKEFSVNDVAAKADGNNWVVTVPVSALSKTMTSNMTIFVSAINFTEHPSADIVFDMSSVKRTGNNGDGSAASSSPASSASPSSKVSSSSSSHASSASSSSKTDKQIDIHKNAHTDKQIDIHKNAHYVLGYRVYKTGTKTTSTMQQYMTSTAVVDVKNGQATIYFKTQNGAMSLMKYFAVNGHKAHAKALGWQVTLPVSDLFHTLKSNMTIYVPTIHFTEKPSADIVFDVKNAKSTKQTGDLGPDKQTAPTNNHDTTANNLGSQNRLGIPNATLHQLTILQGNSNSTSVAAQYFLPTIQLVKNSNGSYTGYITTHTPTMMGSEPITFMDGSHQVKRVSNIKTGNYYQATYKFSLSASEIKAPISTKIHVHFTVPLNYNHIYTIRLVIGRTLNNASDVSRGTSDPVATGTFENTSANTDSAFSQQSDEKANKPKHSDKKDTVKSDTNVSKDTKADQKDNTTRRNILIVAGGVIAAALGYVGVSLLTNFFKKG